MTRQDIRTADRDFRHSATRGELRDTGYRTRADDDAFTIREKIIRRVIILASLTVTLAILAHALAV